jgi:hypothetical protein
VLIPKKLATLLGGVSQVLLCHKVASAIHLVDPKTCKLVHLNSIQYFHHEKEIRTISAKEAGSTFQVLDCERRGPQSQNLSFTSYSLALIDRVSDVTLMRLSDFAQFEGTTHLTLSAGIDVVAFDLEALDIEHQLNCPVVVVKRVVEKKPRKRVFKLRRLEQEGVMVEEGKRKTKKQQEREEREYEDFVEELE